MCVPLRVKDRMTGLLYVDSRASSKEFSDRDLTLFRALAGQVGLAVDNARLLVHYVEKQRMQEELKVAQQIQQSLLPRGGLLVPYSDGIVEAMSPAREPFGIERMKEILRRQRDLPAKDLVSRIRQAVRDHTGTDVRQDDVTLVVAKVT